MQSPLVKRLLVSAVTFFSVGCSNWSHPAQGGAAGAVLGAGTGAAVGSLIANGNVTSSAWLGAAIGVPVGAAAGYLYDQHLEAQREAERQFVIDRQLQIYETDRMLERRWMDARLSHPDDLDEDQARYMFIGPSLGNPYR
jgi:hypothetical protein